MDIVTRIASNAICGVFRKVYNEIKNLHHLGKDVQEMKSEIDELDARKVDIDNQLQRERKAPLKAVEKWLAELDATRTTVEEIQRDYDLHKRCWIAGCCPDCVFRLKLTRRVRDCKSEISGILEKHVQFNGRFGEIPLISRSESLPMARAVGAAIQAAQQKIEDWLINDDRCRVVGVYGMPGVGKTTLLKIINNSENVQSAFDIVIWATISQNLNAKQVLTRVVIERLHLNLSRDSSEEALKAELRAFLRGKYFLVILDDVWGGVELEEDLGVPFNQGRGKIILSSRSEGVIRSMNANESIKVYPLTSEEGWRLFCRRAFGDDNVSDVPLHIRDVAEAIAEECGGLPLAINSVAAAMPRWDDRDAWSFALQQLQTVDRTFYDSHINIDRQLFQCLRWSYDALTPLPLKVCFLICSSYSEDTLIPPPQLIARWIAEELIEGREEDYLHDRGFNFIKILRDRCLIETTEYEFSGRIQWVKVHDVLRDFAIRIAEEDGNCLLRAGQNLETFPTEMDTRLCKRLSLHSNKISSLPPTFACPNLVTLTLGNNDRLDEAPESFFHDLPSLKALDLHRTKIKSLPASVGMLKPLVFLDLSATEIEELPESFGNLTALRSLYLIGCRELRHLPSTIGELKCLGALVLSGCEKLSDVPVQISQITSLEELDLQDSGVFVGERGLQESKEMCLNDLVNFRLLRELRLQIKSGVGNWVMGVSVKMRLLFLDCWGGMQTNLPEDMVAMQELQDLYLRGCDLVRLPGWISGLKNLKILSLFKCQQLREVSEVERLPRLTALWISSCDEVRDLGERFGKSGSFATLERLFLINLLSLESVIKRGVDGHEELEEGALPRLKMLKVWGCPKLNRFPLGMERLSRLEKIEGDEEWWTEMIFQDDNNQRYLQNLYVKA